MIFNIKSESVLLNGLPLPDLQKASIISSWMIGGTDVFDGGVALGFARVELTFRVAVREQSYFYGLTQKSFDSSNSDS